MIERMSSLFRSIKYGIKNLIKWFPVIWKDRNWDQYFLYIIIQFKLKRMEELHRVHGNCVGSGKTAKQIKLCINLLERLIKDEYLDRALEPHEKKWGESKLIWKKHPTKKGYVLLHDIETEKAKTIKEKKQEESERRRIYELEKYLRHQDLDILFSKLRKNAESWWD